MADREQRNGRMLFTDFDASDKGRPVAVFGGGAAQAVLDLPPPPAPNVPSLDDIAASLGFEFEDDGAGASAPPSLGRPSEKSEKHSPEAPSAPSAKREEEDHELVLDETENLKNKTGVYAAPPVAGAPTWDALTSAYARARPVGTVGNAALPGDRFAAAFAPPAREGEPEEDDSVDVLSLLDEYLERENRAGAEPSAAQPEEAAAAPFPEARHIPYGGVERVDDWFAPPEKEPEQLRRIEDWFSPPEEQPDGVARIDNWYEPPEERSAHDDPGETKVDISWLSDFRNELPAGEYWHKKTTRIVKSAPPADADAESAAADASSAVSSAAPASSPAAADARPAAGDTADLFADMDFDSIWERKVAEKQQSRPAPPGPDDTRRISLFDNIDIEGLWDRKQAAAGSRAPQAEPSRASAARAADDGADTTIIASPDGLSAAGTVILRDGLLSPDAFDFSRGQAGETARADERRPPDPEAPGVPEELDGISADAPPRRGAPAKNAPPAAAPSAEASPPPSAQRTPAPREQRATAAAERSAVAEPEAPAAASAAPDDEEERVDFDVDDLVEEAAGMDYDGTLIDGDRLGRDDADGAAREYVARTPPADPPGKKGLSTDDILNDIDLDSLAGGTGDVSAPVIDDSAIDDIPAATRTGTAEMRAVAGDDAAEERQPVAVNPMDVFADMDNMDFSDDVDDDMRSMLEDEEAEGAEEEDGAAADAQAGAEAAKELAEALPATRLGRAWRSVSGLARRYLPMRYADKALGMVAWRENWWFYCDLVAAVVASASLAVIISYFFWYRGV